MKKLLSLLVLALLILVGVVLVRTVMFSSQVRPDVEPVSVALDAKAISGRMAESIRFPTISTGDPATQEFAAFRAFQSWARETYSDVYAALALRMIAEHTLLFKWQGSNPDLAPILLTAHYDVVPIAPNSMQDWVYPPFAGEIADGYVWGRGAMDDKSGMIVMLEAVSKLLSEGWQPARSIYLSFGHDEEIGGTAGAAGVADYLQQQGVQLAWSLDEGSFIVKDVLDVVDLPVASINVAEKGSMTLDLTAHGPGGHSSMPAPEVAVDILAQALVNLRKQPVPGGVDGLSAETFAEIARNGSFGLRMIVANQWLFGGLLDQQLSRGIQTNALLRTTTAPTILDAGIKTNVIPPTAKAAVNFRLHPRDTPESVRAHVVQAIDDERVTVEFRGDGRNARASEVSSWQSEGYRQMGNIARQVFGDVIVVPGLTLGGTDSKHYSRVADDSYRFQYMLVTPEDLAGFHGTNERVSIDNLVKGTSAYYLLLRAAAGSE